MRQDAGLMGGEEAGFSSRVLGEQKGVGLYPIYFGVSCAFAAVHMLAEKDGRLAEGKWSVAAETMLQGSAQLLGLLAWKAGGGGEMEERSELVEKARKAELEVAVLRRRRNEDAKANEKVVSIFAGQEQNWICEKKRLRLQIQALANELRLVDAKNKQLVASLNEKIKEKDEEMEEEVGKRSELEERLQMAEMGVEDMREAMNKDALAHLSEIWKHKTAFIELVSNQRRLEAEMGRAIREAQAANKQLEEVVEQKQESDEMVKKVSEELVKLQKDAEQKDRILSAMLRKSKLDSSEKHVLMKEVKISKARRKQAELETERWKGSHFEERNGKVLRGFWGDGESFRTAKSMEVSGSTSGDSQFSQGSGLIAKALVLGSLGSDQKKDSGSNIFRRTSDGLHGENGENGMVFFSLYCLIICAIGDRKCR